MATLPSEHSHTLPRNRPRRLPPSLKIEPNALSSVLFAPPTPGFRADTGPTADSGHGPGKPRSLRNLKKLSLSIPPSAASTGSANSLHVPEDLPGEAPSGTAGRFPPPPRRASVISLPAASGHAGLRRRDEDDSPTVPYLDGPIEIMPQIWIGAEDNARDWQGLHERGIKSILNVAKELSSPFENLASSLRSAHSTSGRDAGANQSRSICYPPNLQMGRPAFHYLKLPWSHGQANLVKDGFPHAMSFVDEAIRRREGVLIHCQCGVSRSATLIIALVMRAAALSSEDTPAEIRSLRGGGMHAAYAYVKEKSKWIGPNMALIYQLLDYERTFQNGNTSPSSSVQSWQQDEHDLDWARQRRAMDGKTPEEGPEQEFDPENAAVHHEARALDQEMEERNVAKKATSNSGLAGKGVAWRSRFGFSGVGRTRTGSTSSTFTARSSVLSASLLEEEEGKDPTWPQNASRLSPSTAATEEEVHTWKDNQATSRREISTRLEPLPSTTNLHPIPSFVKSGSKVKPKRRPAPLVGILPPVPCSPLTPAAPINALSSSADNNAEHDHKFPVRKRPVRKRTLSQKPSTPPSNILRRARGPGSFSSTSSTASSILTPSQTLFVFPPDPSGSSSTLMLTSTPSTSVPFPVIPTPRVATSIKTGRRQSFIGVGQSTLPTTAFSIVEARGENAATTARPPFSTP